MMRAKLVINSITVMGDGETLNMSAVCKNNYDEEGKDENNSYAKFTPQADLTIHINNPDLAGKFKVGQEYYLDFTEA